jgi:SNF2 family DNA or RNA helicase
VFLISLKAGGTGLNLTSADTVIHYDPWWNAAAQAQATDRAHRIGQTRPVFVYNLVVAGSVEERMLGLQRRKQHLADTLLGAAPASGLGLDAGDVEALLSPLDT